MSLYLCLSVDLLPLFVYMANDKDFNLYVLSVLVLIEGEGVGSPPPEISSTLSSSPENSKCQRQNHPQRCSWKRTRDFVGVVAG